MNANIRRTRGEAATIVDKATALLVELDKARNESPVVDPSYPDAWHDEALAALRKLGTQLEHLANEPDPVTVHHAFTKGLVDHLIDEHDYENAGDGELTYVRAPAVHKLMHDAVAMIYPHEHPEVG